MKPSKRDFVEIESIGSGQFGNCSKIQRISDGKIMMWKKINVPRIASAEDLDVIRNELEILIKVQHPNIVKYYGNFRVKDGNSDSVYIIMEYCKGGDLRALMERVRGDRQRFNEVFIWAILVELLEALKKCHGTNLNGEIILHRDLKPGNIFLTEELDVKLGDFGCSRIMELCGLANTQVGTICYMAPEVLLGNRYDEKCDIWSLGCTIYEMCTLRHLFHKTSPLEVMNLQEMPPLEIPGYSEELVDMIVSMLQIKPDRRPSAEDLYRRIARIAWNQSIGKSVGGNLPVPQSQKGTAPRVRNFHYGMGTTIQDDDGDEFLCPLHGAEWDSHGTCSLCSYISSNPKVRKSAMKCKEKVAQNRGLASRQRIDKQESSWNSTADQRAYSLARFLSTDKMQSLLTESEMNDHYIALCPDHGIGWTGKPHSQCTWCERNRYVMMHLVLDRA